MSDPPGDPSRAGSRSPSLPSYTTQDSPLPSYESGPVNDGIIPNPDRLNPHLRFPPSPVLSVASYDDLPESLRMARHLFPPSHSRNSSSISLAQSENTVSDAPLLPLNSADVPIDDEKVLYSAVNRRSSGVQTRQLGVIFENLRVVGLGATAGHQNTFASLFDPRVWLAGVQQKFHPPLRDIISGFEGVVLPNEMLLVLGSPGSGCSTLLKILANQRKDYHAVKGEVFYDAFTPAEMEKRFRGDIIYCAEDDVHFPTLTVDQTLRFAAKTRTPHDRIEGISRDEFIDGTTRTIEHILGLAKARDTVVGDAAVRGVSGGEKKRVSIGEMLALRAVIGAWDNSTRGLDASTALEFVTALRTATDKAKLATIVSIYQAGEPLYKQFDKVCVIYEGRMAYFGPADVAKQYFIDLGFEPAPRQTTADFLTAVTDPNARMTCSGFEDRAPRTAAEFADAFLDSYLGGTNRAAIKAYKADVSIHPRAEVYKESVLAEHARTQRDGSLYITSIPMQFRAAALRRLQIIRGDLSKLFLNISTYVLQAVITGTVFLKLKTSTDEYFSRCSVLSIAIVYTTMTSLAEIHALFGQRKIILKHFRSGMYHPFVEAAVYTIVDIPIVLVTIALFTVILYFLVGLQRTVEQYLVFAALMFIVTITIKVLFRAIAAAVGDPLVAQTIAGLFLLASTLYSGFMIPRPYMVRALKWINSANPLSYGFEGMVTNEFRTVEGQCATLIPRGPPYDGRVPSENQVCATVGSVPGKSTVDGLDYVRLTYEYTYSHLARNFIILGTFALGFFLLLLIFTEINTKTNHRSSMVLFKRGSKRRLPKSRAEEAADEEDAGIGNVQEGHSLTGTDDSTIDQKVDMHGTFTWQHLQYTVPVGGGKTRCLLDNVSGYVAPGKLTALMGESGAGKTTLLNVLAQRQDSGVVIGTRLIDGRPLPVDFRAQTGYCQQVDTHLAETTVREALLFSALLRQPASVSREEKETYVESVLIICGLAAYADAIVGTLGVEYRKRTTIGVELAARPKLLLFLDEPTSGLDSQSAWAIMSFLRNLADHGQAILCTIHQPSAELFQVFDRLLLLRKGGQTVYFGDIGPNARDVIGYFEKNGGHTCPPDDNPAEYVLDVIGAGATASSEIDWHKMWKKSSKARQVARDILRTLEGKYRAGEDDVEQKKKRSAFATSWFFQTRLLLSRDLVRHWRDPNYLLSKLILNVVAAVFIGMSFFQAEHSIQGTLNKRFSVFVSMIVGAPLANQILVPFIATRKVYELRERPSRMYRWTALLTAQILGEIPWNIVGSCCYFAIWYWLIGFPTDRAGYAGLLMGIVYPLFYTTLAQGVAAVAPTPEIAAVIFSFVFSILILPNGVLQPVSKLGWWVWVYRLSPYTYLIEGALGIAIGNTRIDCAEVEFVNVSPPQGWNCSQFLDTYVSYAGGTLTNPGATDVCVYCPYNRTNDFLETSFNIVYSHHWRNLGLVWAYIMFNVFIIFAGTYACRIYTGNPLSFLRLSNFRRAKSAFRFTRKRPQVFQEEGDGFAPL